MGAGQLMYVTVKQSGKTFWNFPRALQDEGGEGAQTSREGDPEGPLTNTGEKNLFVLLVIDLSRT